MRVNTRDFTVLKIYLYPISFYFYFQEMVNGTKRQFQQIGRQQEFFLFLKYNIFSLFWQIFPCFLNFFLTLSIFFLPLDTPILLFKMLLLNFWPEIVIFSLKIHVMLFSVCLQNVDLSYMQYDCSVWIYDNSMFCKHSENFFFNDLELFKNNTILQIPDLLNLSKNLIYIFHFIHFFTPLSYTFFWAKTYLLFYFRFIFFLFYFISLHLFHFICGFFLGFASVFLPSIWFFFHSILLK